MPLNDILESLVGHSTNVASVNLSKPSERVSNYLIPSQPKHKKLVRDAESYECKLYSLGGNEQAVARISAEYSTPSGTAHRQNLERLLSAANTLNQICDNPSGTRERIEELAQKHEELQLNIDYLESTRTKNAKEMLALQRSPSQPKKATKDDDAVHLQHDIAEYEATIGRLQRVLKNKDASISQLSDSVTDQLELQSHFNDMDTMMDELDDMSFEYTDVSGEELNNMSSEERYQYEEGRVGENGLTEVWEKAKASIRPTTPSMAEDMQNDVISLTERIGSTLQDVIDNLQLVQSYDSHITILGDVNQTLINTVIDQAKSKPYTSQPTSQAALSAKVLRTIRDYQIEHDKGIPLAQLKSSISSFATSLNCGETQGNQSIYMLVANSLITIDRNEKGSPVKIV
ncbi:hypothetical protein BC943DRAFT_340223 [Umbelopsis sp. AD052]|nr:hypothetical protein BC943DRAFT_340223 [Umbelopsis sp. AD052]